MTSEGEFTGQPCMYSSDCNIGELECDPNSYCFTTETKSVLIRNSQDYNLDWNIPAFDPTSQQNRISREEEEDYCLAGYCPGDYIGDDVMLHDFEICYGTENVGENFRLSEMSGKIMFIEYSSAF
tara:strand:- start:120 stop:494 length:375 start_codon:yes stop_codon:yes gene_type:complete